MRFVPDKVGTHPNFGKHLILKGVSKTSHIQNVRRNTAKKLFIYI